MFVKYLNESTDLNPMSDYEQIAQYKNRQDIFLTFSSVEKQYNYTTSHNDISSPFGLYAYPLKDLWKHYNIEDHKSFKHLPYSTKRPFIQIFRYNYPIVDVSSYNNLEKDMNLLDQRYGHLVNLNIQQRIEQSKNPFKTLWGTTKDLAKLLNPSKMDKQWNTILRNLGYGGFTDNKNTGILHHEPYQALILRTDDINILNSILNKHYKHSELLEINSLSDIIANLDKHPVKFILRSIDGKLAIEFQKYLEKRNNENTLEELLESDKLILLAWMNGHVNLKQAQHYLGKYLKFEDVDKAINYAKTIKYPWNFDVLRHNLELVNPLR